MSVVSLELEYEDAGEKANVVSCSPLGRELCSMIALAPRRFEPVGMYSAHDDPGFRRPRKLDPCQNGSSGGEPTSSGGR